MNISSISGISPAVVPQILPAQPSKQNSEESFGTQTPKKETMIPLMEAEKEKEREKEEKKIPDVKLEDLIMKPTPIPLEERMNQIISVEEVKDILSMISRVPLKAEDKHKVDFKR